MMSMEIEYKQWLFLYEEMFKKKWLIKELFKLTSELTAKEDIKKVKNAIYHWLVYVNQDRSIFKYERFPLLPRIYVIDESTPEWALKLVKWIEEKKLFSKKDEEYNREESHLAVKRFLEYIHKKHDELQLEELTFQPILESREIKFGKFTSRRYTQLPYLLDNISDDSWSLTDITNMILRYESIGINGFQRSYPKDFFKCLYDDFGVRFEGFASPLNVHHLGKSDYKFCSLFPDTDKVFGSIGNFFDIKLSEYPGAWVISSPFIEDILDKVTTKVIDALDSGVQSTYFCIYPHWNDNESWINLQNSKHTIKSLTKLDNVVQEDVFGKVFSPNISISFFCLSFDKSLNLESVENIFKKTMADYK